MRGEGGEGERDEKGKGAPSRRLHQAQFEWILIARGAARIVGNKR